MAHVVIDLDSLQVGDRVRIIGDGSTQGFQWDTRIKRITKTLIVCENGHRFNRITGYPSPYGLNYAHISAKLPD